MLDDTNRSVFLSRSKTQEPRKREASRGGKMIRLTRRRSISAPSNIHSGANRRKRDSDIRGILERLVVASVLEDGGEDSDGNDDGDGMDRHATVDGQLNTTLLSAAWCRTGTRKMERQRKAKSVEIQSRPETL